VNPEWSWGKSRIKFGHGKSVFSLNIMRFGKKGFVTNYNNQQCMELLLLVPTNITLILKCVVRGCFRGSLVQLASSGEILATCATRYHLSLVSCLSGIKVKSSQVNFGELEVQEFSKLFIDVNKISVIWTLTFQISIWNIIIRNSIILQSKWKFRARCWDYKNGFWCLLFYCSIYPLGDTKFQNMNWKWLKVR
jgi:hypothetical protein